MKHLQILNLALAALAATLALVLGVVSILYLANLDAAPKMQRELPRLLAMTLMFSVLGGYAALVWWAQRVRQPWAPWSQAMLAPVLAAGVLIFMNIAGLQ
ncbi:MAG: hypothetical protein AABY95_01155 [Pseudomonadota bacterium]